MPTECIQAELDLGRSGGRKVVGAFDGGAITSNGGVALLAGADRKLRLAERLAACFSDLRVAEAVTHTLPDLLRQRIFGLALGYEDLIDHDALRFGSAPASRSRSGASSSRSRRAVRRPTCSPRPRDDYAPDRRQPAQSQRINHGGTALTNGRHSGGNDAARSEIHGLPTWPRSPLKCRSGLTS
jgi:hypothetical protein